MTSYKYTVFIVLAGLCPTSRYLGVFHSVIPAKRKNIQDTLIISYVVFSSISDRGEFLFWLDVGNN